MAQAPSRVVYSTTDPATLATYRRVTAARDSLSARLRGEIIKLGGNGDAYGKRGTTGEPDVFTSLGRRADGYVPAGWIATRDGKRIQPAPGRSGESAREWLAAHQPPDVLHALAEQHGLPRTVWVPIAGRGRSAGTDDIIQVEVRASGDTLWAIYPIEPGGPQDFHGTPCTWTRRSFTDVPAPDADPAPVEATRG